MDTHDRWGAHLEYFKLSIALTTALIAAAAAIYVDASKIPTDYSRYVLLGGVGMFALTFICSVWGVAILASYLVHYPADLSTATQADKDKINQRSDNVARLANASFFSLFAAGVVLVVFFGIRTFQAGEVSYQRAITTAASANATLVNSSKNETATLKSLDLQGDKYQLVYQITPGPGTTTIVTDSAGTQLISAHRQ